MLNRTVMMACRMPLLLQTKDKLGLLLLNNTMATRLSSTCRCSVLPVTRRDRTTSKPVLLYKDYKIRIYSTSCNKQKVSYDSPMLDKDMLPLVDEALLREKNQTLWKRLFEKAHPYIQLARMDKPIGTWLLFWPCSWSISLAALHGAVPPADTLRHLALFLAGAWVMRGAGCTINDMWDADIDSKVERTKARPLVSGALSRRAALAFLAAQLSAGLAVLLQLNWYSVLLGASSMALVVTYPLAKRFTNYPQLFLGATFNWGALLGWSAQLGSVEPAVCLPLYAGAMCWSVLYDTIYALQDKADDLRIGIKSTAITFGEHERAWLSAVGVATVSGVAAAGWRVGLDWPFYAALAGVSAHLARQICTLRPDDAADCAAKFRSNSAVGLIVLLGIAAGGWSQYRDKIELLTSDVTQASEPS